MHTHSVTDVTVQCFCLLNVNHKQTEEMKMKYNEKQNEKLFVLCRTVTKQVYN